MKLGYPDIVRKKGGGIMTKKAYFYIDDTIWMLRDITRERPESMFDNPILKALKDTHERYGLKVQLNLFYRTDYFYGNDDFSLADVTDAYKSEWEESSDWLKLAFHAKQEFPDYPHINATYEDIYSIFKDFEREVKRFAGDSSFTYAVCPHWLPVSLDGVRALYDCGVRLLDVTQGETRAYDGDPSSLPYGHAGRLLQNRQPETRLFTRGGADTAIARSICGYNHFDRPIDEERFTLSMELDEKTGMYFKKFGNAPCLNLTELEDMEREFGKVIHYEYLGICVHEQYYYADYYQYQPDYIAKIYKMCEILRDNGYEYMHGEELI